MQYFNGEQIRFYIFNILLLMIPRAFVPGQVHCTGLLKESTDCTLIIHISIYFTFHHILTQGLEAPYVLSVV